MGEEIKNEWMKIQKKNKGKKAMTNTFNTLGFQGGY